MATIITIETPTLGDRSYLVHDGSRAFVVDPQRDIDRVTSLAEAEGVLITDVFETHIHNDYVTGGLALAEHTGAVYHVNADDDVAYQRHPIRDGDTVRVSETLTVRAIATPGHTFTHLAFAVHEGDQAIGVFTGGSLLFGATGRPDLLGEDNTDTLVRHQYSSAHRLATDLPENAKVLPTHGFGSFCAAGGTSGSDASTIGEEKRINPALNLSEEQWVANTLSGLDAYPAYYAHMGPANEAGPAAPDLAPPAPADSATIAQHIANGDWVVDLRSRTAFADGHVRGTLNIGLDGQFSTYLGWLIPWGTPLTLLGDTPDQVAEAQRELVRIGIDELEGSATGEPSTWTHEELEEFRRATFADLKSVQHHRAVEILDVRRTPEFDNGHIEGARNIPLHQILARMAEVPQGDLWVHCAGGYRASIAVSALAANGHTAVLIDDNFDEHARESGLIITEPRLAQHD